MPNSNFWKFDEIDFIRAKCEESAKIRSMSRTEFIAYINDLLLSPPTNSIISQFFHSLEWQHYDYGGHIYLAQDIFVMEMNDIFKTLYHRLKEMDRNLRLYETQDLENVKVVMDGDMSNADYTAFDLVHRFMTKKQSETTKKKNEIQKYTRDLLRFKQRFGACIGRQWRHGAVIPIN